jgi:hypothetical protein
MKMRDHVNDPSSLDLPKSLKINDSLFGLPSEQELSSFLGLLSRFSNSAQLPEQLLKDDQDPSVNSPSLLATNKEDCVLSTSFRDSEFPRRRHFLDPDEQCSLQAYHTKLSSCSSKKVKHISREELPSVKRLKKISCAAA